MGVLLLSGCQLLPSVCTEPTAILGNDGGVHECTKAENCPLPGNILICTNTDDYARDCVDCINTHCQRFSRTECDGGR
jgi:hypothetical protein